MLTRAAKLRHLLRELAQAQIGATFNQYRDSDGDDASADAPHIRVANACWYLSQRADAPVVFIAEAAGWRGARYSGLCLYCERQIDESTTPLRRTSCHPRGWSEPSATVVQAAIAPWAPQVLLWNLLPTHPRRDGLAHRNRPPLLSELRAGAAWTQRVLDIIRPAHVGAIGRHAAAALGATGAAVRHPSHGGATLCSSQLRALLEQWLPTAAAG